MFCDDEPTNVDQINYYVHKYLDLKEKKRGKAREYRVNNMSFVLDAYILL